MGGKLLRKLRGESLEDQTRLKNKLTKVMSEDVKKRFSSSPSTVQGGYVHGGVHWKPLSESYVANNPTRQQGRIYIDSGALMRSFEINSPNLISDFSNNKIFEFGTSVPYAKKLDKTRPIVFFHEDLLNVITETYLEWATETK